MGTISLTYGTVTSSLMRLIGGLNEQIADLERELESSFEDHPDARTWCGEETLGATPE